MSSKRITMRVSFYADDIDDAEFIIRRLEAGSLTVLYDVNYEFDSPTVDGNSPPWEES